MTFDAVVVILGVIVSALSIVGFGVGFIRSILNLQIALDRRLDDLSKSISNLAHRIELDEQAANLRVDQLDDKIDYRSLVLQDQIDQLSLYLAQTTDFQIRRRIPKSPPPDGGVP